jgi:hypothetical protein
VQQFALPALPFQPVRSPLQLVSLGRFAAPVETLGTIPLHQPGSFLQPFCLPKCGQILLPAKLLIWRLRQR